MRSGLFAGSGTSTPTLQAAIATLGNDDPAVGYSVSYPFGVAGPILFLYFAFMILKPKIEAPAAAGLELLEIALRNPELLRQDARRGHERRCPPACRSWPCAGRTRTSRPRPDIVLAENDVVLAVGPSKEALEQASKSLGEAAPGRAAQGSQRPRLPARLRLPPARGGPGARRPRPAGGARRRSSSRCAAATPTSCRGPTSCSSSATASACSPIAATSRRCASSSATRSRARPSSATSPSASAWRSASCSARSRSRSPASASSRSACRAC